MLYCGQRTENNNIFLNLFADHSVTSVDVGHFQYLNQLYVYDFISPVIVVVHTDVHITSYGDFCDSDEYHTGRLWTRCYKLFSKGLQNTSICYRLKGYC